MISTLTSEKSFPTIQEHIVATPGTCGGRPRIAGHRITVQNIAIWHERCGMTAAQIVEEYPQLTLAEVHAALSFYYDHRGEILDQIKADEEYAESMKPKNPSLVAQKLAESNAQNNSISPG